MGSGVRLLRQPALHETPKALARDPRLRPARARGQDGLLKGRPYATDAGAPWLFTATQGRSCSPRSLYILEKTDSESFGHSQIQPLNPQHILRAIGAVEESRCTP